MHRARQIRLVVAILTLLVAVVPAPVRGSTESAGGPDVLQVPQTPRKPRAPRAEPRIDKKKEAKKGPPLSTHVEWTRDLPAPPRGFPAFDRTRAYVRLASGQLAGVSLGDGKTTWSVPLEAAGNPVAGEGLVFVPTIDAIEARDAATGASRWRVPFQGRLSAPLVWQNGWLLLGTDRAELIMLRGGNGERLWQRSLAAPMREAALTGDRLYVPLENGHLAALALDTGETIWDRDLATRATAIAPLDDRVFVGADDKFFYCLSAKDGKRMWRWRTGGTIVGTPAFDKDNVYFLSLDNVLRALDRGNGTQAWHAGVPFRPLAGPVLKGRRLLVTGLAEVRAYHQVDGTDAGNAEVPVLAAPPHFIDGPEQDPELSPFILFTREGQLIELLPAAAPLESKPFPPKSVYPLWPGGIDTRTPQAGASG